MTVDKNDLEIILLRRMAGIEISDISREIKKSHGVVKYAIQRLRDDGAKFPNLAKVRYDNAIKMLKEKYPDHFGKGLHGQGERPCAPLTIDKDLLFMPNA